MKIISGWKDYYDHVAHIYGGGDPKVIYNRDYVVPDRISHGNERYEDNLSIPSKIWSPSLPKDMNVSAKNSSKVQNIEFRSLIVMDRHFILERQSDIGEMGFATVRKDWHITTRRIIDTHFRRIALLRSDEVLPVGVSPYERARMQELLNDPLTDRMRVRQGTKEPKAIELCIFAKAPVFAVEGNRSMYVFGRTPKLSSLGVAPYIQPQQLYQELAMFVGNVLNPVEQPPSTMKDIEKVSSHGFDKKISFRHRK